MSELFWLLFFHLLADYPLQGQFISIEKGKNNIILLTHAGIWTGMICLGLVFLNIEFSTFDVIFLFVIHTIADYLKARRLLFHKNLDPLKAGLVVDQSIHVLQILFLLYV